MDTICSICKSTEFKEGYGGRLSITGKNPTCVNCGSVERHRIIYSMYEALVPITKNLKVLHFAPDITLNQENFAHYEGSTYGGKNSLDMMNTKLPENSFDIVVSNHVLEHIKDQFKAIREMIRVVGKEGVVHICIPSPSQVLRTRDWGFANEKKSYHFRWYGADAGIIFRKAMEGLHIMVAIGEDSATNTKDLVFWLSLSSKSLDDIGNLLLDNSFTIVFIS